jgi:dCTP deaminase
MPESSETPLVGTLTDADISNLVYRGELIVEGFDPERVRQACYELTASEIFWETGATREDKKVIVSLDFGYVLRPHSYVTAIVRERIRLPANMLGRILTKGQLFSVGILPVNTYADPGFEGRLGITLYNASHRYLVIRPGQPIAKIEFSVLSKPVTHPYSGQHGYETEIWPIPTQYFANLEELQRRKLIRSEADEIEASYGPGLGSVVRRFGYYERRVWIQIIVPIIGFATVFALYKQLSILGGIAIGVAGTLLANLLTTFGSRLSLPRIRAR